MTFMERLERKHMARGSKGVCGDGKEDKVEVHKDVGAITGGKVFSRPFRKRVVVVWVKIEHPSTGGRKALSNAR